MSIMNKKYAITILALFILLVGIIGYVFKSDSVTAATGSGFHLQHEYIEAGASGGAATSTISTQVASTTPIYYTAVSTTTINILTANVSDLRLNMIAHATTTAGAPTLDVVIRERGNNGQDHYQNLTETSSTNGILLHKSYQWTAASTTGLAPESDNFAAGSFQISNINSPYTILDIGSDSAIDFHIEIVKTIPNL